MCSRTHVQPPHMLLSHPWKGLIGLEIWEEVASAVRAQLKGSDCSVSSDRKDLEKGKLWFSCTSVSAQCDFVGICVLLLYLWLSGILWVCAPVSSHAHAPAHRTHCIRPGLETGHWIVACSFLNLLVGRFGAVSPLHMYHDICQISRLYEFCTK